MTVGVRDGVNAERVLVALLRLAGVITLLALPAVLLPQSWMAATHAWLGLGVLPDAPVVEYLARSSAALYAVEGGLLLLLATDVRRYRRVLRYVALAHAAFGAAITAIDAEAGLPLWWTLGEGPPVAAFGLLLLVLLRSVPGADSA